MNIWFHSNSMLLIATDLANELTGGLIDGTSGVTVTAELVESDDTLIAGSAIALTATGGTPGRWTGVFSRTLVVPSGAKVLLRADGGEFLTGLWTLPLKPQVRRVVP